jgi:hypothetical protein
VLDCTHSHVINPAGLVSVNRDTRETHVSVRITANPAYMVGIMLFCSVQGTNN